MIFDNRRAKDKSSQPVNAAGSRGCILCWWNGIIGWDKPLTEGDPIVLAPPSSALKCRTQQTPTRGPRKPKGKGCSEDVQKETQARMHTLQQDVYPRGLASSGSYGSETFTIGDMADSLYEYFPSSTFCLVAWRRSIRHCTSSPLML